MTILLYDYCELEERASRSLRVWKVCHIIIFCFAAVFGIVNYVFLESAMELIDNNCILYPRQLAFHSVEIYDENTDQNNTNLFEDEVNKINNATLLFENKINNDNATMIISNSNQTDENRSTRKRRESIEMKNATDSSEILVNSNNANVLIGNKTHHIMLDTSRTLFGMNCDFAEYMPILSTVFAIVWLTMFVMCPAGGKIRYGLQQPWRVLLPALIFALVMVGLTGHSFTTTNGGLQDFCAAFQNYTNATTCSSVGPFLERERNASLGIGSRAAGARAACAGVWASWACAAALLLARCLAAPDFAVRHTTVYLAKDPQQKITPHLMCSMKKSKKPLKLSIEKEDTTSEKSGPTPSTELVTVTVEKSDPDRPVDTFQERNGENEVIEMTNLSEDAKKMY